MDESTFFFQDIIPPPSHDETNSHEGIGKLAAMD